MSGLFGTIGRVKIPEPEFSSLDLPSVPAHSEEMQRAMMEARVADLQHAAVETIRHVNEIAKSLEGVQSDDIRVDSDPYNKTRFWSLPEKDYEEPATGGGGGDTGITDFRLYMDGSTLKMAAGRCEYYQGAANTWDAQDVSEQTVSIPGSGYTFIYIKRTLDAADAPTYEYKTSTTRNAAMPDAFSDDDIHWIGWVKSDGTFANDNLGPWHEKRMA